MVTVAPCLYGLLLAHGPCHSGNIPTETREPISIFLGPRRRGIAELPRRPMFLSLMFSQCLSALWPLLQNTVRSRVSRLHIINLLQYFHHLDSFMCDPVAWLFCVNLYLSFSPLCMLSQFSWVQLFVTLWIHQASLSIGFPSKNTGVWEARILGCHVLLQGIFPAQGLNLHFLYCRKILYAELLGKPSFSPLFEWNSDCLVSLNVGHYWILVSINRIRQAARDAPLRTLRAGHLCLIWHIIF